MTSSSIKIKGQEYSFAKLDVFEQADVVFSVMPVLTELFGAFQKSPDVIKKIMASGKGQAEEGNEVDYIAALVPVTRALTQLPKETRQDVFRTLLNTVSRKSGGGFSPVLAENDEKLILMYADIDLPVMLTLCARAVMQNLGNFFTDAQLTSLKEKLKPKTP